MSKNSRQFPRVDRNALVAYEVVTDGYVEDQGMAHTLDLSMKGMSLVLPRQCKTGAILRVHLAIEETLIPILARAVRTSITEEGCEVGLDLVQIPEEYVEQIEELLERHKL